MHSPDMTPLSPAIGILGGTFDPVHCGHLRLAIESRELIGLAEVRLLPAGEPRLRSSPQASAEIRLKMLHAATSECPGLLVDDRELANVGPTITVETLSSLRAEFPRRGLCLILGMDAFARLPSWIRWQELLELAHIVVATRPGARPVLDEELSTWLALHRTETAVKLHETLAGKVFVQDIPGLDISASQIRCLARARRSLDFLVPGPVRTIIEQEGLYTHAQ